MNNFKEVYCKFRKQIQFRRYFISGLIFILPVWISLWILWIIFTWIGNVTGPFLRLLFGYFHFTGYHTAILLKISSFLLTLILIYVLGLVGTNIVGRKILLNLESVLLRIPILRGIYLAARKLIQYAFTGPHEYRQVVLIEYPRKGVFCMGFATSYFSKTEHPDGHTQNEALVNVFVPTIPNPTTGYLLILPESEVIPLDISIDESIKTLMSGGIIKSDRIAELIRAKKNVKDIP